MKIHGAEYLEHIHFAEVIYFAVMNVFFNGDKVYKQLKNLHVQFLKVYVLDKEQIILI